MKQKTKILIVLFVLVIVVAMFSRKFYTESQKTSSNSDQKDVEVPASSTNLKSSANTSQNSVNQIPLKPVDNSVSGSGELMQSFDGQFYVNLLQANLPQPKNGTYYEAWLVKTNPTADYYSLGQLEKNNDQYAVDSISKVDRPDYKEVIVTSQTDAGYVGDKPGQILLKGSI